MIDDDYTTIRVHGEIPGVGIAGMGTTDHIASNMDDHFGRRMSECNLRPRKQYDYSHLLLGLKPVWQATAQIYLK
jgi:hypothetical protein